MANRNAPRGFVPVCDVYGKKYDGSGNRYYKSLTANMRICKGDRVVRIAATDNDGFPEITKAAANAPCTGVVVGFDVVVQDLHKLCLEATDTGFLMVEEDPNVLYQCQEDSVGGALTVGNIGMYINPITNLDGDAQTGISKLQLDSSTVGGSSVACRIERLDQSSDNTVGDYAKWLVRMNQSTEINDSANNLTDIT